LRVHFSSTDELSLLGRRSQIAMGSEDIHLLIPDREISGMIRAFGSNYSVDKVQLFFAIRALAQRINDHTSGWLAPFGLTAAKYNYLAVLYANRNEGLSPSEISNALHTVSGTVSSMITNLVREGLVKRKLDTLDRRRAIVTLTKKGERLIGEAATLHHAEIDRVLEGLSAAEIRNMIGLLVRVGTVLADA
jgi:DNA-binding MarR family transcriptional regulator